MPRCSRRCARRWMPRGLRVPIVAGSRAHFTELNREWHIIPREVDGVAFSIDPAVPLARHRAAGRVGRGAAHDRATGGRARRRAAGARRSGDPAAALQRRRDHAAGAADARRPRRGLRRASSPAPPTPPGAHPSSRRGRSRAPPLSPCPGVASIACFEEWGAARHPLVRRASRTRSRRRSPRSPSCACPEHTCCGATARTDSSGRSAPGAGRRRRAGRQSRPAAARDHRDPRCRIHDRRGRAAVVLADGPTHRAGALRAAGVTPVGFGRPHPEPRARPDGPPRSGAARPPSTTAPAPTSPAAPR